MDRKQAIVLRLQAKLKQKKLQKEKKRQFEEVLKIDSNNPLSRSEATRKMCEYLKANNLVKNENGIPVVTSNEVINDVLNLKN